MQFTWIRFFCSISHLVYGILTLFHPFYIDEFVRYGFSNTRILIGIVQILAGAGLLFSVNKYKITTISALALALLMAGALGTRININDNIIQSLPALLYLILNSYIFIKSIKH